MADARPMSSTRRKWLWLLPPIVFAAHILLGLLLNFLSPPPPALPPIEPMNITMVDGASVGLGPSTATARPAADQASTQSASAETPPPAPEPQPQTDEPSESESATATDAPAPQPAQAAPSPAAAPPDVLAQVRAILGQQASAAAEAPPAASPEATSGSDAEAGGGQTCAVADALTLSLLKSDKVQAALTRVPRTSLSVSGAVLVWDRAWIDASALGGPEVLDAVRVELAGALSEAPEECRGEAVVGPRFLVVRDVPQPLVLVLGSGEWRWTDLFPPPPPVFEMRPDN